MKKVLIGIFIVIVAVAIFWFLSRPSAPTPASSNTASLPTSSNELSPVSQQAPSSPTMTLGTPHGAVTVNNFYKTALGAEDEFIIIAKNSNYEINYDTNDSGFDLDIKQPPFDANRASAEENFLSVLGVSKSDACKLTVAVEAEVAADPNSKRESFPLSFCASSTFGG